MARAAAELAAGAHVAVISQHLPGGLDGRVDVLDVPADSEAYARSLYRSLREADARGVDVVLAVPPVAAGLGAAVADRLRRAAGGR